MGGREKEFAGDSLYERIVRQAADAIVVADAEGKITFWNLAAGRLFGFSEEEAVGQSLSIIIPEGQRERHWRGYSHVMETGTTKYGTDLLRVPAVRKDGSRISVAFTVSLLKGSNGRVEGIFAIVRDDSERWNTEKMLRQRVHELERAQKNS